jgi:hypothetical protein
VEGHGQAQETNGVHAATRSLVLGLTLLLPLALVTLSLLLSVNGALGAVEPLTTGPSDGGFTTSADRAEEPTFVTMVHGARCEDWAAAAYSTDENASTVTATRAMAYGLQLETNHVYYLPLVLRAPLPALTLPKWPRPARDNGLCIHFYPYAYHTEEHLDLNIARMVSMKMKWALVLYADEIQLEIAAPKFRAAGITVVWRKMLYPGDTYFDWARDVGLLQSLGMPPYMQIYNEPSIEAGWENPPVSKERFMKRLLRAARDVYNAGGYVGLQFIDTGWLSDALQYIKSQGGQAIFRRMFFVPHPYGLNHPPSYQDDQNAVLGFLYFADIFQRELGFVPPMIAGEGGWKYGATDDNRFPRIDDQLHRDYHLELFNWFRRGRLSNGDPLPDYLFAFCPWLLASTMDDSAWFDSFAGDRVLTIQAVTNIPRFVRRFSWD